jgi:cell division topological specificity factor
MAMFENVGSFFKKFMKNEPKELLAESTTSSKDAAKERLHIVLMQDRANVSADFLELMKEEIIEVIKKYIVVDESQIDVRLTNQENEDGSLGAPLLHANIPIINIRNDIKGEYLRDGNIVSSENTPEDDNIDRTQIIRTIKDEDLEVVNSTNEMTSNETANSEPYETLSSGKLNIEVERDRIRELIQAKGPMAKADETSVKDTKKESKPEVKEEKVVFEEKQVEPEKIEILEVEEKNETLNEDIKETIIETSEVKEEAPLEAIEKDVATEDLKEKVSEEDQALQLDQKALLDVETIEPVAVDEDLVSQEKKESSATFEQENDIDIDLESDDYDDENDDDVTFDDLLKAAEEEERQKQEVSQEETKKPTPKTQKKKKSTTKKKTSKSKKSRK